MFLPRHRPSIFNVYELQGTLRYLLNFSLFSNSIKVPVEINIVEKLFLLFRYLSRHVLDLIPFGLFSLKLFTSATLTPTYHSQLAGVLRLKVTTRLTKNEIFSDFPMWPNILRSS